MAVSALADVALDTTIAAEPASRLVVRERRVSMKDHPARVDYVVGCGWRWTPPVFLAAEMQRDVFQLAVVGRPQLLDLLRHGIGEDVGLPFGDALHDVDGRVFRRDLFVGYGLCQFGLDRSGINAEDRDVVLFQGPAK